MKIPLSWIKEFLTLDISVDRIAEALTLAGLEVEKIDKVSLPFEGVVVASILSVEPHPNADKLRVAKVTDGSEEFQIVCGASNCRPGIKTALAKIGATLTDASGKSFKIKKGKLRDVESLGMLCASNELGLSEDAFGDSKGIMELPSDLPLGTDLTSLYQETILDIGLTPNLGHCMSILGIARELSAILSLPLKRKIIELREEKQPLIEELIHLKIEDRELCPLYACRVIQNIKVGPSPDWMKRKLEAAGMRSINNVVDVGNFVMLELGLPLHMFDYDSISGKTIRVSTHPYPFIKTLDGETRAIPQGALLICDNEGPIALAGIMGSENSGISPKTQNILIEASQFKSESIRKTSKLLGLRTEGSQRHEKETDPEGVLIALDRATELLQKCAGGEIAKGRLIERKGAFIAHEISLRIPRVNALLGTTLSKNEIISLLERLEIKIKNKESDTLRCAVPSYRNDLKIEIDLIEEIARLYGFNNISQHPPKHISSSIPHVPIYLFEREVRGHLMGLGLQECLTCDLISPKLAKLTSENNQSLISVLHPTSIEQSILRISLLPGLLQTIKYNQDRQNSNIQAFEVGRIHFKNEATINEAIFVEQTAAAIILTGKSKPHHWKKKSEEVDFFDLKGKVEDLLDLIGVKKAHFEVSHLHNFHPFRQARIKVGDVYVGALGEIHPAHLNQLGISDRVYFAELNMHDLFPLKRKEWQFKEISPFPGSERDWTLSLKEEVPLDLVIDAIKKYKPSHLEKILLLDLYKSPQIGKDKKNVTFRFSYRDLKKTIELETVEREHTKLIHSVAENLRDHIL